MDSGNQEEYHINKERRMNEYRLNNVLCDVIIQVEDRRFPCHRIVLASACEYFAVMLIESNFKDGSSGELKLNSLRAEFFEEILSFMYTGKVDINDSNSYDLLVTSDYLGLQVIKELCVTYIQENLSSTTNNVLEILQYAVNVGISSLTEVVVPYVSLNISSLSVLDSFTAISYDALKMVLQCVYSKFENPNFIMTSVIRWMKFNLEEREIYISDLGVQLLEHGSISADHIFTLMRGVMANEEFVDDTIFDMQVDDVAQSEPGTTKNDHVFPNISPLNVYVWKFNFTVLLFYMRTYALNENKKLQQWENIRNTPQVGQQVCKATIPCCCSRRTAIGSNLYHLYVERTPIGRCVYHYEYFKSTDRVTQIRLTSPLSAPMAVEYAFQLCSVGNTVNLYAARIDHEATITRSFKPFILLRYNCDLDKWFSDVPKPVAKVHGGCLVSCSNNLYLLGGRQLSADTKDGYYVQRYDCRTPSWQSLPLMINPHTRCPAACEYDGKLYITGGLESRLAEVFDPVAGKWYEIALMKKPRKYHQLVSYKNLIWAIGSDNLTNTVSAEVYDSNANMWMSIPPIGKDIPGEPSKPRSYSIADACVFEFVG